MSNSQQLCPRIHVDDPRYYGMLTDAGNLAVCELITDLLCLARDERTTQAEIEQALREGIAAIIAAGHDELPDGAREDYITTALCNAWQIESDTRLVFDQFDQRWQPLYGWGD